MNRIGNNLVGTSSRVFRSAKTYFIFDIAVNVATLSAAVILSACGAPKATPESISAEVRALTESAPKTDVALTAAPKMSGNFLPDLKRAVLAAADYRAAQSAAAEAEMALEGARSLRRPQVELDGTAGSLREVGKTTSSTTTGLSANLFLRQIVYDGGESVAQIDGAAAATFAAKTRAAEQASTIAQEVGAAWIDLWQFDARRALLASHAKEGREMLASMQNLIDSGMIDRSVTTSAEIALRDLDLETLSLETQLEDARLRFARYLGKAPNSVGKPTPILNERDLTELETTWIDAPALQSAAAGVLVSRQELAAAQARMKPSAGLRAGVTSPTSSTDTTDYVVGLELRWILGDGGRRKADVAAKEARLASSQATLEGLKQRGKVELDSGLSRRSALIASLTKLRAQDAATAEENKILWSQLTTGQTSMRQLIDAEITAYRSADRRISAEAELLRLDLEIAGRSGLLLKKIGLEIEQAEMTR